MIHRKFALPLITSIFSLAGAACSHADGQFTFRDAAFMPRDKGEEAARQFISKQIPAGLPLADAVARLHKATMGCKEIGQDGGVVNCEYYEIVGSDGGTLGDDIWSVKLTLDDQRHVLSAIFARSRSGFSAEGTR